MLLLLVLLVRFSLPTNGELINCSRSSIVKAFDFTNGLLDAIVGTGAATQVGSTAQVSYDGTSGMLINGSTSSGLDLGFVEGYTFQASDPGRYGGFSIHVLATLDPHNVGDSMIPVSWVDLAANRSTLGTQLVHGEAGEQLSLATTGVTHHGNELQAFTMSNQTLAGPVLLSFSVFISSNAVVGTVALNGTQVGSEGFSNSAATVVGRFRGNLFLGLNWPFADNPPRRVASIIHAVYVDEAPLPPSAINFTDISTCFPSTLSATPPPSTQTTPTASATSTVTPLDEFASTGANVSMTVGEVGDGAPAVQDGDDTDDGDVSSASPLTMVLVVLAVTAAVCALACGFVAVTRARRRRTGGYTAKGSDLVTKQGNGWTSDNAGSVGQRGRRSSTSRVNNGATSHLAAKNVGNNYSAIPVSTSNGVHYEPIPAVNGGSSDGYRTVQMPEGGGTPVRTADYANMSNMSSGQRSHTYGTAGPRSHGYATTEGEYVQIGATRKVVAPPGMEYATGNLSGFDA